MLHEFLSLRVLSFLPTILSAAWLALDHPAKVPLRKYIRKKGPSCTMYIPVFIESRVDQLGSHKRLVVGWDKGSAEHEA
jgi:hypothetical protein